MIENVIEGYDTLKTKGLPRKLFFGDFNEQTIPPNYYNFLNDDNDNDNNIFGTRVYDDLLENEGLEDVVMVNDEDINY